MSTGKSKMGCLKSVMSDGEAKRSSIFSRNAKVTEFLELSIQPTTVKEMEAVLLKFWEKFESLSGHGNFSEVDVVCMFVLSHAYEKRSISLSAMSRSLFAYQRQVQVKFFGNTSINPSIDCFLKELRDFENLYTYSRCEEMLVDVGLGSVLDGGLGLTLFLVKFGLMEFPAEDNTKGRKMVEMLVMGFNGFIDGAEGIRTSLHLDALLYRMRHSNVSFRRCLMILCTIVIVAEYYLQEKIEARFNLPSVIQMKDTIFLKLKCLDVVNTATTETKIILRDIQNFLSVVLSSLLHGLVCRLIMETARKLFRDASEFHNPRSLKDLARCKIRTSLRKRRMLSEQVNQLAIPDALKEYIFFQREEIWNLLKENHVFHDLNKQLNENYFLIRNLIIL